MDNIPRYINVKHGLEEPELPAPAAGADPGGDQRRHHLPGAGDADRQAARRLHAGRRRPAAPRHGQEDQVRDGRPARGVHRRAPRATASPHEARDTIFEQVAKFASYGFNKSHAAAYALLAYQTAYLKANHPVEFFAAAMTIEIGQPGQAGVFRQEMRQRRDPALPAGRQRVRVPLRGRGRPGRRRRPLRAGGDQGRRRAQAMRGPGGRAERQRPASPTCSTCARGSAARCSTSGCWKRWSRPGALDCLRRQPAPGSGGMRTGAAPCRGAGRATAASGQVSLFGGLPEPPAAAQAPAAGRRRTGRRSSGCSRSSRRSASTCRRTRSTATGRALARASGSRLRTELGALRRPARQAGRRGARQAGAERPSARALPSSSCPTRAARSR